MRIINCEDCGDKAEVRAWNAKYCPECKIAHRKSPGIGVRGKSIKGGGIDPYYLTRGTIQNHHTGRDCSLTF